MQHYYYASVTEFLIMPTSRKRIGFLPSSEVQEIIDKICLESKLSQSKVTGLLVEEALKARLVSSDRKSNKSNDFKSEEDIINRYSNNNNIGGEPIEKFPSSYVIKNEYEIFKEYFFFKNFKKMIKTVNIDK